MFSYVTVSNVLYLTIALSLLQIGEISKLIDKEHQFQAVRSHVKLTHFLKKCNGYPSLEDSILL